MPGKLISLYTVDNIVVSESARTAGDHRTLDFVPGSNLLGAVAGKLYRQLTDKDEQWAVFHSGQLRFGNLYPSLQRGMLTRPLPLSYHEAKYKPAINVGTDGVATIDTVRLSKFENGVPNDGVQYKQIREGYVNACDQIIRSKTSRQMKTAVNYEKGTVSEGQLYGYESLQAGQWFCGELSWSEKFEDGYPGLADKVLDILTSSDLRVGRARSAEFGRVSLYADELSGRQQAPLPHQFAILCLSDVSVQDDFGQPALALAPHHFGLQQADLSRNDERCFIRQRATSVYNGARGGFDQSRHVIGKGSVFSFTINGDIGRVSEKIHKAISHGIGSFCESGLGSITLLDSPVAEAMPLNKVEKPQLQASDLINWLKRVRVNDPDAEFNELVQGLIQRINKAYQDNSKNSKWPSKSHWMSIYNAAKQAQSDAQLYEVLFGAEQSVRQQLQPLILCEADDGYWGNSPWLTEFEDVEGSSYWTVGGWFRAEVNQLTESGYPLHRILEQVARQVGNTLEKKEAPHVADR